MALQGANAKIRDLFISTDLIVRNGRRGMSRDGVNFHKRNTWENRGIRQAVVNLMRETLYDAYL